MSSRQIILNAFNVLTASQNGNGLWRHPEDQRYRFNDLEWWIEYAQLLERSSFTGLVFADSFGTGDVNERMNRIQIEEGVYFPASDPFVYVPALAACTERLVFVVTASTTFENPYGLARRFTALDHLSKGRVGWNIVTSFVPAMAKAFGTGPLPGHTARYDRADEFLAVAYKLWEASWEDGAESWGPDRRFDPEKIHEVHHHGPHFSVEGRYSIAPSPQRTPVLFQAGHSEEGQVFAARHAEVVLVGGSPAYARAHIESVRGKAEGFGRDPEHLRFIAPVLIVTDENEAMASQRLASYKQYWSKEASLASIALYTGYDLSTIDPDSTFEYATTERHRAAAGGLRQASSKKVKDVIDAQTAFPGGNALITGGPEQVADELEYWVDEVGVDGFNLMELVSPSDLRNVIDHVVPLLQKRDRLDPPMAACTLRERMFPGSGPRLAHDHPARRASLVGGRR